MTIWVTVIDSVTLRRIRDGAAASSSMGRGGEPNVGAGYAVTAVHPPGVNRPWSPQVAEPAPDASPSSARVGVTRRAPVDATPAQSDLQAED